MSIKVYLEVGSDRIMTEIQFPERAQVGENIVREETEPIAGNVQGR